MSYLPHVYIDLDTDGANGWVDITTDVLARPSVRWEYGIRSNKLTDRIATTGAMDLTLDNAGKHYSPDSTDCTVGFGIGNRIKITFEGNTLTSNYEVVWSSEIAYSDSVFGDGMYHAQATDRNPTGTLSHNSDTVTSNFVYLGSDITISFWVRPSSDETWGYTTTAGFSYDRLYASVFDFQAAFDTDAMSLNLIAYDSSGTYASKSLVATLGFSTDSVTYTIPVASSTDWIHVCAVIDVGTAMYLYVNGVEQASGACVAKATSDGNTEALRLFAADSLAWLGSMGHLAIYNRALSSFEVQELAVNREFQKDELFISYGGPPSYYWQLGGTSGIKTKESGLRTDDADAFTKFLGYISSIAPEEDIAGNKTCLVSLQDWMARSARYNIGPIPVQNEQPSGTVFRAVLNYSNIQPLDVDIDAGLNSFIYAADKGSEETVILSELNKIAKSEPGFVYERHGATSDGDMGEVLVYEGRARRQQELTNKVAFDDAGSSDSLTSMKLTRSINDVYNRVRATIHPVVIDNTNVVIYDQDTNVIPEIPPNSSIDVYCEYSDSDSSYETVGAIEVQTPQRTVDYTIAAGSADGPDVTLDIRENIKATHSSNLIAYWPLTDASMNAIVDEITGETGYIRGNASATSSNGLFLAGRTWAELSSSDVRVFGSNHAQPLATNLNGQEGTVVCWMDPSSTDESIIGDLLFALSASTSLGTQSCRIELSRGSGADSGSLIFRYCNVSSTNTIYDTDFISSNIRMAAATWSYATGGHQLKLYVDGALVGTSSDIFQWPNGETLAQFGANLSSGVKHGLSGTYFSHLAIWDTPLASSDISALYASYVAQDAITMTIDKGGVGSTVHFYNPTSQRCYITKLTLKGKRIKRYREAYAEALDDTSRNVYGQSNLTWDMPYETDPEFARLFAQWLLKKIASPTSGMETISFTANASDPWFKRALILEPGDRISIQEDQTAVNSSYHVAGMEYQLKDAENLTVTLYVVPADQTQAWNAGVAGFSEAGVTTYAAL